MGVAITFGVGLTNTVARTGIPEQLLTLGVIVKVTVIGEADVLIRVPLISPLPVAAIPVIVATLSLVH